MPAPEAVNGRTISQLFYDSLALSAWKSTGETRWALRVNASSGNLHPTEGYLVVSDTWYPGWQATVDGEAATIERANVHFRAVYLP